MRKHGNVINRVANELGVTWYSVKIQIDKKNESA